MKDEILRKVVSDELLTMEEIIYLSRNLDAKCEWQPRGYDHTNENPLEACGVSLEDRDLMNSEFAKLMSVQPGESRKRLSQVVENVEKLIVGNEAFMKMVIIQCIKFAEIGKDPLERIRKFLKDKGLEEGE